MLDTQRAGGHQRPAHRQLDPFGEASQRSWLTALVRLREPVVQTYLADAERRLLRRPPHGRRGRDARGRCPGRRGQPGSHGLCHVGGGDRAPRGGLDVVARLAIVVGTLARMRPGSTTNTLGLDGSASSDASRSKRPTSTRAARAALKSYCASSVELTPSRASHTIREPSARLFHGRAKPGQRHFRCRLEFRRPSSCVRGHAGEG